VNEQKCYPENEAYDEKHYQYNVGFRSIREYRGKCLGWRDIIVNVSDIGSD
jgi:hypothetical protein